MTHEEEHIQAHERAIESDAAGRYLLDQLPEAERDAFEEHFFDCVVCGETIRAAEIMFASGRELVNEERESRKVASFTRRIATWFPQAAAAVLVVAIGVPILNNLYRQPRMEPVHVAVISTDARGANENVYKVGDDEQLALSFDVPPSPEFPNYRIGVRTAKGKTIDTKTISAETAKNPQLLLLRQLPAGSYELVIEGVREDGNRAPVSRSVFTVQR